MMARAVLESRAMLAHGSNLWAVILAGGEGTRLAPLTRALYGTDVPKQFAVLSGTRSMLQTTIDRVLPIVPPSRIVVVVGRTYEALAHQQLGEWGREITVLAQPRNLDTGPGLMLPLAVIRERDPDARVAVFPADHYLSHPAVLRTTIGRAGALLGGGQVALLGAEASHPDTEYGWIVPGQRLGPFEMHAVERFVEKPKAELAAELLQRGALWNTFIMVGAVRTFWDLSRRFLPDHAALLARAVQSGDLDEVYADMPVANFSRAVLERAGNLVLVPLRGAGWSDWGTPRRVFESLEGTTAHTELLGRMAPTLGAAFA